jgi:glutaredoxin
MTRNNQNNNEEMGRIVIFGTNECPHCMRAKGALLVRGIPFTEIDLLRYPRRREDIQSLLSSQSFTIPQVFFNTASIGGADELIHRLEDWDEQGATTTAHSVWERNVQQAAGNPTDPRLATPTIEEEERDNFSEQPLASLPLSKIPIPNGVEGDSSSNSTMLTALELIQRLDRVLDQSDRPYKAHWYKHCFVNTEAVVAVQQEFQLKSRQEAVQFLQRLQRDFHLLHHVCDDHIFRDDGNYFFRLCPYHQPDILNSYLRWNNVVVGDTTDAIVNRSDPMAYIFALKRQLYELLNRYTDHNGRIDYVQTAKDELFVNFEVATCALQGKNDVAGIPILLVYTIMNGHRLLSRLTHRATISTTLTLDVDMATMDETTRQAFGLNLYNLFITYAFIKVGIGTSSLSRGAFFGNVKMNVGGDILSFNDLENGILRANTRHPYANKPPFSPNDPRRKRLALSELDCRIHFGLNCGAKSCPPIRFFRAGTHLEEELQLVSQAFCQGDDAVHIKEDLQQLHLSMLFKWFQTDFCGTKDELPERLLEFLTGPKQEALERMIQRQNTASGRRPISIRFLPYDWTANASSCTSYRTSQLRANEYSITALMRCQGHFHSCWSPSSQLQY